MEWSRADKEGLRYAPSTIALPAVLERMAPSNATDTAFCASLVQNPPTSPSQALVRLNRPIASSHQKESPNPCVCSKSSQTHCVNLLTFYRLFGGEIFIFVFFEKQRFRAIPTNNRLKPLEFFLCVFRLALANGGYCMPF